MNADWIEISMIGFGICLSTSYFLRSCYLKKVNAKKLDTMQQAMLDKMVSISHKIDLVDRQLQDMCMDIKDLNIRTNVVETRLEERNAALLLSATAAPPRAQVASKRGRPRKTEE